MRIEKIYAGKLRRYYGESNRSRLFDFPTLIRNFADFFAIGFGFVQSVIKLVLWRPQVIFCKGGFVCLPVGYAAALLRIPLVIHDSDAHPGLTNRLLARFATFIATGAPLEYYNYPAHKARYVGIPTKPEYRQYTALENERTKKLFHVPGDKPLLVVVGGSLGAKIINNAMIAVGPELVKYFSIIHIAGMKQYDDLKHKVPQVDNYKLIGFLSDHLGRLLGAADIVITRAGASAMAELAATGSSVVMVPASQLADQQKNAKVFEDASAALLFDEKRLKDNPESLRDEILQLLSDHARRQKLGRSLSRLAKPKAASETADLLERAALWR